VKKEKAAQKLKRRYQSLASQLSGTGPVLQGTIIERTISRENRKNKGSQRTYGPYYQWTFKRAGKTVTVNLTKKQAKIYQKAIDNNRELEKNLKEMRVLSEQILEVQTEGVKRRKARK
jgi:hypothetical protein